MTKAAKTPRKKRVKKIPEKTKKLFGGIPIAGDVAKATENPPVVKCGGDKLSILSGPRVFVVRLIVSLKSKLNGDAKAVRYMEYRYDMDDYRDKYDVPNLIRALEVLAKTDGLILSKFNLLGVHYRIEQDQEVRVSIALDKKSLYNKALADKQLANLLTDVYGWPKRLFHKL